MNSEPSANSARNQRIFRLASYALVFLMQTCVVLIIGNLISQALPDWQAGTIAGILAFVVLDRLYTYGQLKSLTPFSSEWTLALGAQWVLIAVLIRLLLSYADGLDALTTDLALFARGDLAALFSPDYIVTLMLALLVWFFPARFLELLDEIGLDPELALRDEPVRPDAAIVPAHQRLVSLTFSLGITLVILTVLTRINVRTILANTNGLPDVQVSHFSGAEAGALLYFVFGLTLLSLSRLMSLQTRWNRQRIPVSSGHLVRQWWLYSLVFLLLLGVFVSLLPAGDSLGFLAVLGAMINFLVGLLFFVGQLILVLLSLLLSLPLLLLRGETVPEVSAPAPLPTLVPVAPSAPVPGNETWAVVRSLILWGALAAILVFAFIQFVRQHGGLRAALRQARVTNWLILAWQWLYKNADQARDSLSRALAEGLQSIAARRMSKQRLARSGWLSFRTLDARRQIYFFYHAMVRRGGEQGVPRNPSQTPSEYALTLESALPSAVEDVESITEAFVTARYSRQEVDTDQANLVKATWGRIRRAFQNKVKSEPAEK